MIKVVLRFQGMRPEGELREKLDGNNETVVEVEDRTRLKNLLESLHIEPAGKLIRINQQAVFDMETRVHDHDLIEIFGLYAGG